MKKRLFTLWVMAMCVTLSGMAQNYREQFEAFKKESAKTYQDFRNEINQKYADFIRQNWPERESLPALEKPLDAKPVPPVFFPEEELDKEIKGKALPYLDIVPVIDVAPQPMPIIPIDEIPLSKPLFSLRGSKDEVKPLDLAVKPIVPKGETTISKPVINVDGDGKDEVKPLDLAVKPIVPKGETTISKPVINVDGDGKDEVKPIDIEVKPIQEETYYAFNFWNTEGRVRIDESHRFKLRDCSANSIADAWELCSGDNYRNLIYDCLRLRDEFKLCDWAYLQMLQELSKAFFGGDCNEATFLTAYLYCQSGYKMRMARAVGEERLYLLVCSKELMYGKSYFKVDGESYYVLSNEKGLRLKVCEAAFEQEQSLSLVMGETPLFDVSKTDSRALVSKRYPDIKASVSSNKNLIDFYNNYPSTCNSVDPNDFMRRWALYANAPMAEDVKEDLYPALEAALEGYPPVDAVNRLLNFVQTSLSYEYDDKVWGGDRAFFAEESLYYPYCDCEDRSILFSRLVRDLVGLEVVLVYYPGHLATAVKLPEGARGDYIMLNNEKFIVCDPTFIGAPSGRTMPNMNNAEARVILLE